MTRKSDSLSRRLPLVLCGVLAAACLLFFGLFLRHQGVLFPWETPPPALSPQEGLRVHMLDVGQGLCVLLTCNGRAALVDTGPPESAQHVIDCLAALGVRELDYLFLTHPHLDHAGGGEAIRDAVPVHTVVTPDCPESRALFSFPDGWGRGMEVLWAEKGQTYSLGGTALTVLHPRADTPTDDLNVLSMVLLAEFEGARMLFTGDIPESVERSLLPLGYLQVLQAAHHGSNGSTCAALLEDTTPDVVLISCGKNNDYGHPHSKVLQRLREVDAQVWRTDRSGDILVSVTEGKLSVSADPSAPQE